IDDDRIGPFPTLEQRPRFGNYRRRSRVRGIDVHPDLMFLANVGYSINRLDTRRRCRPDGRYNADRKISCLDICPDRFVQTFRYHLEPFVDIDLPQRPLTET